MSVVFSSLEWMRQNIKLLIGYELKLKFLGKEDGSPYICEYNDHFLTIKVNIEKFGV